MDDVGVLGSTRTAHGPRCVQGTYVEVTTLTMETAKVGIQVSIPPNLATDPRYQRTIPRQDNRHR